MRSNGDSMTRMSPPRRSGWPALQQRAELLRHQRGPASEVALHENYIELLTTVHAAAAPALDWNQLAISPAPPPPAYLPQRERAARLAAESYKPTLTERMFGGERTKREELAKVVEGARAADTLDHQAAVEAHRASMASWEWHARVANGVNARDVGAYRAALDQIKPFEELVELGVKVVLDDLQADAVAARVKVRDMGVVPEHDMKLTATGKVSQKAMPKGRAMEIYQAYVCGTCFRVAREVFAVLPIPRAIVNVSVTALDASTGHKVPIVILGASLLRETASRINFERCDPVEALSHFDHRVSFKKSTGFERVDPITFEDQFVHDAGKRRGAKGARS
jgi:hypothetical protein